VTGYSYDGNGNVLTGGSGQTYTWDVENRMTGSYQSAGGLTTATFSKMDTTTQGTWKGTYGANGSAIAVDSTNYPSYAQVTVSGTPYTWVASTTDPRALQQYSGSSRIASTWYNNSGYTIDVNLTDGQTHQIALYCLDWDGNNGRSERIDVLNAGTGAVLDTRTISSFSAAEYLVWNASGHVSFRVTALIGNAVISGIFFDGAPGASGGLISYDPNGKLIQDASGTLTFWSIQGQKLGTYTVSWDGNGNPTATALSTRGYFKGRIIGVATDRLGTVRWAPYAAPMSYRSYGMEQTATSSGWETWATYQQTAQGTFYAD